MYMKYLIKRDVCLSVSDCCQTLVVFDLNSGKSNSTFSSLFTFHPLIFFPPQFEFAPLLLLEYSVFIPE